MKKSVILCIVLGTIAVVSVAFAVFFAIKVSTLSSSLEQERNKVAEAEEKVNSKNEKVEKVFALPEFDSSKCANPEENVKYYYSIIEEKYGVTCTISQNRKYVQLVFDPDKIKKLYNISISNENVSVKVDNFEDKIVSIYAESIDHSKTGNEVLLFLLEDGSVEYIPLNKALKDKNIKSYGKVPVVEDILSLFTLSIKTRVDSGDEEEDEEFKEVKYETHEVPGAFKNDGTFYDLSKYLFNTGNFKEEEKK